MGLFDKVKQFANSNNNNNDSGNNNQGDYVTKAENMIGEDRVNQFKSKIGEDRFDKMESKVRQQFSNTSINDNDSNNKDVYKRQSLP